ncbi:GAP family protein [Humibacillus xanthopallidus]|uniref:Sap-like sulfolipid-1-addressing protein n=1 Tax=Humibacillus xanthopallidus TaxID=412689 RepID=A0A543HI58_9MICO|nr:GAP family protein [Humibacillus xanthopallidus]TQM57987.1 Sap-like sulfolipid-1-addressing protein [Humibacillus xanthopallidus]
MDGIAAVLPFAVGVAISPVPIIAVILMLFSSRAKVHGPMFALGLLLAGVNPKNLLLAAGAGAAVAGLALPTTNAVIAVLVFVVASLTIAGPVTYYLVGGESARTRLDATKDWLALHHDAVMTVLFLALGVDLISKGIPPLT